MALRRIKAVRVREGAQQEAQKEHSADPDAVLVLAR